MIEPEPSQEELNILSPTPQALPEMSPERPRNASASDVAVIRFLLRMLSERLLRAAGVLLVFSMGCWAMYQPTLIRVGIAGGFAIFMLLADAVGAWRDQ